MERVFTDADGVTFAELIHGGLTHMVQASVVHSARAHLDATAGYHAHLGAEMFLKGWLLYANGQYEGTHSITRLYHLLVEQGEVQPLTEPQAEAVTILDEFETRLREPISSQIPDHHQWSAIDGFLDYICHAIPIPIADALSTAEPGGKSAKVLIRKKIGDSKNYD